MRRLLALTILTGVLAGCAPALPAFQAPGRPARTTACLDGGSCPVGAVPWLLGGLDCRTPEPGVVRAWQEVGHFSGLDYAQVLAAFRKAGLVSRLDGAPRRCRGHVLLGGNCLITPLPGSRAWDDLAYGRWHPEASRRVP